MKRFILKLYGRGDGMLLCFLSKFVRFVKIGLVVKVK